MNINKNIKKQTVKVSDEDTEDVEKEEKEEVLEISNSLTELFSDNTGKNNKEFEKLSRNMDFDFKDLFDPS